MNHFDRSIWVGKASLGEQGRIQLPGARQDWVNVPMVGSAE